MFGTVISGTLIPMDLLEAFSGELNFRSTNGANARLIVDAESLLAEGDEADEQEVAWMLDSLQDALNDVAVTEGWEFTFFGTHPGDASDFGFWPDWEEIEFQRTDGELRSGEDLPNEAADGEHFLQVNERGNTTLFVREGFGWTEVWSVV